MFHAIAPLWSNITLLSFQTLYDPLSSWCPLLICSKSNMIISLLTMTPSHSRSQQGRQGLCKAAKASAEKTPQQVNWKCEWKENSVFNCRVTGDEWFEIEQGMGKGMLLIWRERDGKGRWLFLVDFMVVFSWIS